MCDCSCNSVEIARLKEKIRTLQKTIKLMKANAERRKKNETISRATVKISGVPERPQV